jgi:uncharacterized cysteine cluster protein YcgN (CxxCxxCC family)
VQGKTLDVEDDSGCEQLCRHGARCPLVRWQEGGLPEVHVFRCKADCLSTERGRCNLAFMGAGTGSLSLPNRWRKRFGAVWPTCAHTRKQRPC